MRRMPAEDRMKGLYASAVPWLRYAFFLHSGPSLASFFSVMCASPPTAFSSADFSALMGVQFVHCAGTFGRAIAWLDACQQSQPVFHPGTATGTTSVQVLREPPRRERVPRAA